ncbi:MAG: HlyD family secretion protein [Janthinobacterium lividum]
MDGLQSSVMPAALMPETPAPRARRRWGRRLAFVFAAVLLLGGAGTYAWHWWTVGRFFEETEDAYTAADSVTVSPRVGGQVIEVLVRDNQRVEAGQLLARLDDADFIVAQRVAAADMQSAQAEVAGLTAQIALLPSAVDQAEADITAGEAQVAFAQAEARRYGDLLRTGSGTVQRSQQADADIKGRQAALARSRAALAAARGQTDVLQASRARAQAQADRARAAVQQAGLNLGYARITAPVSGAVGDRAVRVGQTVAAGTRLLDVVPVGRDLYVIANFKETQLAHMSAGELVEVRADILPGTVLHGRVNSLAPGSGSTFALLPPENATGNFTKVVQRVPVRITLDTSDVPADVLERLRPGLSVVASVDVRTQPDGPVRTMAAE